MKYLLLVALFSLVFDLSYAQEKPSDYCFIITTKRLVVKNKKNPTDKPSVYLIPVVSEKYPELKKALADTNLFDGEKLSEVIHEYQIEGIGLESFEYEVFYVDKNFISIHLYYSTMGAHPDSYNRYLTLNIKTGKKYPINMEISQAGLNWIYTNYKLICKKRIIDDIKSSKGDNQYDDEKATYKELSDSIDSLSSKELFKRYMFTKKGIIINTEDILPHAVAALEINRDWFIPYSKLILYRLPSALVIKRQK